MDRETATEYTSFWVDDSLNSGEITNAAEVRPDARLVGWQCGFEPLFVAVQSYLGGVRLDEEEAEELATDYLAERGWFGGEPTPADYIL